MRASARPSADLGATLLLEHPLPLGARRGRHGGGHDRARARRPTHPGVERCQRAARVWGRPTRSGIGGVEAPRRPRASVSDSALASSASARTRSSMACCQASSRAAFSAADAVERSASVGDAPLAGGPPPTPRSRSPGVTPRSEARARRLGRARLRGLEPGARLRSMRRARSSRAAWRSRVGAAGRRPDDARRHRRRRRTGSRGASRPAGARAAPGRPRGRHPRAACQQATCLPIRVAPDGIAPASHPPPASRTRSSRRRRRPGPRPWAPVPTVAQDDDAGRGRQATARRRHRARDRTGRRRVRPRRPAGSLARPRGRRRSAGLPRWRAECNARSSLAAAQLLLEGIVRWTSDVSSSARSRATASLADAASASACGGRRRAPVLPRRPLSAVARANERSAAVGAPRRAPLLTVRPRRVDGGLLRGQAARALGRAPLWPLGVGRCSLAGGMRSAAFARSSARSAAPQVLGFATGLCEASLGLARAASSAARSVGRQDGSR